MLLSSYEMRTSLLLFAFPCISSNQTYRRGIYGMTGRLFNLCNALRRKCIMPVAVGQWSGTLQEFIKN